MPLKLASVRSIIYIYFSLKLAEKCQFQNTRKLDASTPLHHPDICSCLHYLCKCMVKFIEHRANKKYIIFESEALKPMAS